MGVKRGLSIEEAKAFFPSFKFKTLKPSSSGVMDTTYISDNYILKFYERDIKEKVTLDSALLLCLQTCALHVPKLLASSQGWYLYEKLQGKSPTYISYFHIQALARFMARFHAQKLQCKESFLQKYRLPQRLLSLKSKNYRLYKELEPLKKYTQNNDGFIHGDIFTDNTIFSGEKIGIFDFIDGGYGSYVFDIAVALLSFNISKRCAYTQLFLQTYNQKAPQKIKLQELLVEMKVAAQLYGLLRLEDEKNTLRAKELIFW